MKQFSTTIVVGSAKTYFITNRFSIRNYEQQQKTTSSTAIKTGNAVSN